MSYSANRFHYPEPEPEPEPDDLSPWITVDNTNHDENNINQYMKYRRNIHISGSIFSGYIHEIDIRYVDNTLDIVQSTKENLKNFLKGKGMNELADDVDKIDFHIHSHTFDDILLKTDEIIYVCNC